MQNALNKVKKCYETNNKIVPLIILDFEKGETLKNANIIDIAPTVTKLLGVAPNEEWEGKSLI